VSNELELQFRSVYMEDIETVISLMRALEDSDPSSSHQ